MPTPLIVNIEYYLGKLKATILHINNVAAKPVQHYNR